MHARLNLEAHLGHKYVSVRAKNWNVFEDYVIRERDFSTLHLLLKRFSLLLWSSDSGVEVLCDHYSLVLTSAQIHQHLVHLVNQRRVASQVLYFLVGDNEAANRLGEIDK